MSPRSGPAIDSQCIMRQMPRRAQPATARKKGQIVSNNAQEHWTVRILQRIWQLIKLVVAVDNARQPAQRRTNVDEAAREYLTSVEPREYSSSEGRVHSRTEVGKPATLEDSKVQTGERPAPSTEIIGESTSRAAAEQFLRHIEEVAKNEQSAYLHDKKQLQGQERTVFRMFIISAVVSLVILTVGAYFILSDRLAVGILAEVLGLIAGVGTAILRSTSNRLDTRIKAVDSEQRDNRQVLLAVQAALAIHDPKKQVQEVSKLAAWLRERAMGSSGKVSA